MKPRLATIVPALLFCAAAQGAAAPTSPTQGAAAPTSATQGAAAPTSPTQGAAAPSPTLAAVQAHRKLACAVIKEETDWNKEDLHGDLSPLGREICRAMAVAVLGPAGVVELVQVPAEPEALQALQAGQVDVVVGATPSVSTALRLGVTFGPPVFWDAQTFMVHRSLGAASAADLAGKTVCFIEGTDNQGVLLAAMKAQGIRILPFDFQEQGEMDGALIGSHCRAMTAYATKLAQIRVQYRNVVHDFVLLPDRISVAPASIVTRAGDAGWSAIAAATVDTLVQAQMLGVTQGNTADMAKSDNPVLQHLLGTNFSAGLALGLAHDWSAQVIRAVGNYAELYARTVGEASPTGLPLGPNTDCLHGGTLCATPVR